MKISYNILSTVSKVCMPHNTVNNFIILPIIALF